VGAAAALAAGYAAAGRWPGAAAAGASGAAWIAAAALPSSAWLPPACLAGGFGLAAAGLLMGAPVVPMWLGAAGSLLAWHLVLRARRPPAAASAGSPAAAPAPPVEARHAAALAVATVPGLLVAAAGRALQPELPLAAVAILALVAAVSVARLGAGR
jgi:hypothetical protein